MALANLHPPLSTALAADGAAATAELPPEEDEMDSYMYQSVGHNVVAAYAQCMGADASSVSMFRQPITGGSVQQSMARLPRQCDLAHARAGKGGCCIPAPVPRAPSKLP